MREIRGDRLEQSRIRLERDIDNNIPSPPSMSSDNPPDVDHDDISSVDFARHNAYPHASFHSFEHLSHLDSDFYSRHDEDSIALDPDLGQTMSTAAHHASALTLSAGLRGRNHTTGRASPSGAEFDPERPLQDILDNKIADGISLFDATRRSKSKSVRSLKHDETRSLPTFDPVIVDSTTELDRFLRTGHQRPRYGHPYVTRAHSQPSPYASEESDSDSSTPRLSQALGQQFSPKRPRSAPASTKELFPPPRPHNPTPGRTVHLPKPKINKPQPGPSNLNPARHHPMHNTLGRKAPDSQYSKLARGVARGTDALSRFPAHDENQNRNDPTPRPSRRSNIPSAPAAGPGKRPPFTNVVNKELEGSRPKDRTRTSPRVHLPDVTGLTSAVQSPVKGGDGYASADAAHPSLAVDIIPVLDALQTRLQVLERENGVSRRRVAELEFELEECKVEVAKERTRIRDHELERNQKAEMERDRQRERHVRGKIREEENRYREVVEEKKALEALVSTLRGHLARLTSELASHKSLIEDLRADTYAARETQAEVEALRAEVERLAGEVERLKEVVEEGLRERRRGRQDNVSGDESVAENDQTTVPAQVGIDLTYVSMFRDEEREEPLTVEDLEPEPEQQYERESESGRDVKPIQSRSLRFIDDSEIARVESDMRERRSERSRSSSSSSSQMNALRDRSLMCDPAPASATNDQDQDSSPESCAPRPTVQPSRIQASHRSNVDRHVLSSKQPAANTPFPHIRGSRMERLFFSAPEHNARTCNVCHRRKRGAEQHHVYTKDDGYRFGEDGETVKKFLRHQEKRANNREKRNGSDEFDADADRLPPQTVLARVVRELEDDFSHYKAIYLELAEQYGIIDAASNVAKRNVLADHLREVIDTLEQKGDQIASLYDLLSFQDKPLPREVPSRPKYAAFA